MYGVMFITETEKTKQKKSFQANIFGKNKGDKKQVDIINKQP